MSKEPLNTQGENTKLINVRFPTQLLQAIEEYKKENKHTVPTRTSAIINLLETGLNAVNYIEYIKKPDVREFPCTTIRELQTLIGLKRMDAQMEERNFAYFTMNELKELDDLILTVSTILQNLSFYKDSLKNEGFTALYDMGQLAYEKL